MFHEADAFKGVLSNGTSVLPVTMVHLVHGPHK